MAFSGGAQMQIACLLDALLPLHRHEIYYVARRVAKDFRPVDYQIMAVPGNSIRRLGYIADAVPLYRLLREIRPDVIYQRVACGYTGIAAYYARRHGARMLWHISSDTDVIPQQLRGGSNFLRRYLEKRSIEYGLRYAGHIVAQTQSQARLLERNYGRTPAAVVPNFHPAPTEQLDKTGPISVVWIANLKPLKQPEAFVRLAARLCDLDGVRFVLIGAPPEREVRSWYDALVQLMGTVPNVTYVGQKTQDEVNQLLARAHVCVNTSTHEGFPNTFIQAWMREVPVVSLHIDPDGVLAREQIGILAGTEDRLAEAVRTLITNPVTRADYANRARLYAMQRHSMDNARLLAQLIDTGELSPSQDRFTQSGPLP
jgi:glycosyltransferase involved in cell wall biosynthesis